MKTRLTTFFSLLLLAITGSAAQKNETAISEGFEKKLPDLHTWQATYTSTVSRAHSGTQSLHVMPTKDSGGAYFRLDGLLDFTSDYEFTVWVFAKEDSAVNVYISASDGKTRYSVSSGVRGGAAGKWVQLRGTVRAKQWNPGHRDFMLALSTRGESWFDDVTLRKTVVPAPPIEVWPQLETNLHRAADTRATTLRRGQRVTLNAAQAVLAPAINQTSIVAVAESSVTIPAEGLLTFAIDVAEPVYVTGTLFLVPDADLRPGLRAYVLSNDTLIGAPMVRAAPWRNVGGTSTKPAPADLRGEKPGAAIKLKEWRLDKGRHYLTVASPHMRPAGTFQRLELEVLDRAAQKPLYTFALLSDTHLAAGRSEWMNVKMMGPAADELEDTLKRLRNEGTAFAIIAGDMTDGGRRTEIEALARAVKNAGLPVYGSLGNHEVFTASVRENLLELTPELFPGGKTHYTLDKAPLRFVVLDGSYWQDREGNILDARDRSKAARLAILPDEMDWLRGVLAADTRTPTIAVWHYPFYSSRGESSCGYQLGKPLTWNTEVMSMLESAPNVVATMNGHMHYNAVDTRQGITCLQNAAYVEWPNLYRVLRVYPDRMEWEVRQIHNRGFVSEGMLPDKALTWMISVREGDLAGTVKLAPREQN